MVQLLSAKIVATRLAVSRSHVYQLVREHGFPQPLRVGGKLAWLETEVDAWIKFRSEAR